MAGLTLVVQPLGAQRFPTRDSLLRAIWAEAMTRSRVRELAQVLTDSIGPRLTGSPGNLAAHDWTVAMYKSWGIIAEKEQYAASVKSWKRGVTHVDLVSPRTVSLHALMSSWSPGTNGPVEASVVRLPNAKTSAEFSSWLGTVKGKFVLLSAAPISCRPDAQWDEFADSAAINAMREERKRVNDAWVASLKASGAKSEDIPSKIEQAGAAGILVHRWFGRYGMSYLELTAGSQDMPALHIDGATTERIPMIELSCEDYGLLDRLAHRGQGPRVRVQAESQVVGMAPVLNTIAQIPGREKPDEYVVLSAHLDSWDGGTGATDNGSGTVLMMEAMRILKTVYPNPKRTILVRHWSGEEQGIGTTRSYRADVASVAAKTQVVLNQDTGTGLITRAILYGMPAFATQWARWSSQLPADLTDKLAMNAPGFNRRGATAQTLCAGFPVVQLFTEHKGTLGWDYNWTHHTYVDTYDKLSFNDLQHNAAMVAMLAYLASEDPQSTERTAPASMYDPASGKPAVWPACELLPPFKATSTSK
jgi:carboxypeptidase Q